MSFESSRREARQKCWESRDVYFVCLDKAHIVVPGSEGAACRKEKERYKQNCARSWIDYFNKRRIIANQQNAILAEARAQEATMPR